MEHSAFPSDETLAAFIDGRLDEETRTRVVAHVADCEDCYGTVMASRAFQGAEEKPVTVLNPRSRKALWMSSGSIAAAAVIALVIFVVPLREWYRDYSYERRVGITAIVRAANQMESRDVVGRLSGRFEYKPLVMLRGPQDDSEKWSLKGAAGSMRERVRGNASPESLHGLGVAHLLLGEYDPAVDSLEDALAKETGEASAPRAIALSQDAKLLSDLSAAYTARSFATQNANDALSGYDAAQRAWTIERSPEAAWNRALAAEAMHARPLAINAWQDYLALDPGSRWSVEARDRLQALTQKRGAEEWPSTQRQLDSALLRGDSAVVNGIVRSFYPQCRLYLEDEILPRLRENTSRDINLASGLARAISDVFGDRTAIDSLSYIDSPDVTRAFAEFGEARRNKLRSFDSTATALMRLGVPMGGRAQVLAAFADYYARRYPAAIEEAQAARARFGIDHFPSIVAQSFWVEGLSLGAERNFADAHAALLAARSLFKRLEDPRSVAALDTVLASNYRLAGDARSAWSMLSESLNVMAASGWNVGYTGFSELAKTSDLMAAQSATAAFLDEALRQASIDRSAAKTMDALIARAEFRQRTGDTTGALADLQQASHDRTGVKDPQDRTRLDMYLDVVAGNALARVNPSEALTRLTRAVSVAQAFDSRERILMALYGRGVAEEALGRTADAIATLVEGFGESERQRISIDDDDTRVALTDAGHAFTDELVQILVRTGRTTDALLWSERGRGRVTLDAARAHGASTEDPSTVSELVGLANPSVNYVEFHVLPNAVAIWLISGHHVRFAMTSIAKGALEAQIRTLAAESFRGDEHEFQHLSQRMYHTLLSPVESGFNGDNLTIIPDATLSSVPWPALLSPNTGERLGAKYALALAPSITWCGSRKTAPPQTLPSRMTFVLGGSTGSLAALPEAAADADRISSIFRRHAVFGGQVTKSDFANAATQADILHFAGHSDHEALLVGNPAISIDAEAIRKMDFSRTRLVTLASCATSRGRQTSDGPMSISRAFLIANAANVLTTTEPIDDRLASRFSEAFYLRLAKSNGMADALRSARLSVCGSPQYASSRCWAAFELLGVESY